ncbi:hypothetical protein PRIPAC_90677, partial [Pristionchus pacificus]|uniref:Protein kinase domain-containing protein n=1 Tax=Pristionchus pacificus TaxID=54126 RepID=A0A2A6CX11_PRIPA
ELRRAEFTFVAYNLLKIFDLGIVSERNIEDGAKMTMTRTEASGTRMYMIPEQAFCFPQLNAKSDVFPLGLILAELCAVMADDEKETDPPRGVFTEFGYGNVPIEN